MPLPALFGHHFQIAYVVRDTEAAVRLFTDRFGISKWQTMDTLAAMGPESATRTISLAWSGDVMVEFLEANPGVPSIYSGWADDAPDGIRLHHLGFLIPTAEEYAETTRLLEAAGYPTAVAGRAGDQLDFHYADTTKTLGHYYELIHLLPAGANFFAATPHN